MAAINNFPAMTEEQRTELVQFNRAIIAQHEAYAVSEAGWPDDVRLLVSSARIALAALTNDGQELARKVWSDLDRMASPEPFMRAAYESVMRNYVAPPAPVLRVPDGWIKCSERLPTEKDGYVVLVWNGQYVTGAPCFSGQFNILKPEFITHWMPLPQPPEASNEQ